MKRLISGLFSSISDAELFMATMGQETEDNQPASSEAQPQPTTITKSYNNAQEQNEE